jgi:hypothetical protein
VTTPRTDVIQSRYAFCAALGDDEEALFAVLDSIPREAALNLVLRTAFEDLPHAALVALDGQREPRPVDVLPTEQPQLRIIRGGKK